MMEVLVSINSVAEAKLALQAGVKWIDLKDTSHGALSSLSPAISIQVVEYIRCEAMVSQLKITLSATVGDTFINTDDFLVQLGQKHNLKIDIIKVPYQALTLLNSIDALRQFLAHVSMGNSRIIVVFTPQNLIELGRALESCFRSLVSVGVFGVMLDTYDKSKDLFAHLKTNELQMFTKLAKQHALFVGLAGGLKIQYIDSLLELSPDIVGFRSGISVDNNRKYAISPESLQLLMKSCDKNTNLHNLLVKK